MKILTFLASLVVVLWPLGLAGQGAAGAPGTTSCSPAGTVRFVCGQQAPEDLVVLPGSQWIAASAFAGTGGINLINVRDHSTTLAFPIAITSRMVNADRRSAGCVERASNSFR